MVNLPGLVAMFILVMAAVSSIRKRPPVKAGDICTIDEGNNYFGVVKVLLVNADRVHVKMYINKFPFRPEKLDLTTLTMGNTEDEEGDLGNPHIPFDKPEFNAMKPEVEGNEFVTPEEMEAYREWKRQ